MNPFWRNIVITLRICSIRSAGTAKTSADRMARSASMPTAIEPTPPVAPVTNTGPSPGVSPLRSSASTESAAV